MPRVRFWVGWGVLLAFALPAAAAADAEKRRADALALAGRIDRHIHKGWGDDKIVPASAIDDSAFLRRVTLHLAGRIPSVYEVRRFLDDSRTDKRVREVEKLLAGQRYPMHLANVWRSWLPPEASPGSDGAGLGPPLEAWLRSRLAAGVGYDKMVRELVTAAPRGQQANSPFGNLINVPVDDGTSALTFYQAKQFKAENLAEGTARVLLGVRLGCAQCHNHPFADWKREQFWEFAAFFAGVSQNGLDTAVHELKVPNTEKVAKARFLDGTQPKWEEKTLPREILAEWITRKDNPYFARATVNRVWAYFFGIGLIDPVDEMVGADYPASHPELLDELARDFADHDFDLKYLILAITSSKSYQLSSARTDPSQDVPRRFSRAPLLGMTPEQLFDSVAEATRYPGAGGDGFGGRQEFLTRFSNLSDRPTEYQTSIIQALALMNGRLTADATSVERSRLLAAVLGSSFMDTPQRIETLYLAALSRKPREKEVLRASRFLDEALRVADKPLSPEEKETRSRQALADLFWALLNSGEFFFNH